MQGNRGGGRGGAMLAALALLLSVLTNCGKGEEEVTKPASPVRTIGFLRAVVSGQPENQAAFLDELAKGGFAVGRNLRLLGADLNEIHPEQIEAEATARAWKAEGADLVVALSTSGALAARAAAPDLTGVFLVNDPVTAGLLTDRRKPEGRLTGVTFRVPPDRTLDLARRALPGMKSLALLYPPADPAALAIKHQAIDAAKNLGIALQEAVYADGTELAPALASAQKSGAGAVWALNSPTGARLGAAIPEATTARSLPLIANTKTPGALLTLQPNVQLLYRQMARQVARLLKGTPVSQVPVEDPGEFGFEIDLRVAGQLGVVIPPGVVATADSVLR